MTAVPPSEQPQSAAVASTRSRLSAVAAFGLTVLVFGVVRILAAMVHHDCVSVPDVGQPIHGSQMAGFCARFDRGWVDAVGAAVVTVIGLLLTRRRVVWSLTICLAVGVAALVLTIVGANLDALPRSTRL
jgi:hypothetical protein